MSSPIRPMVLCPQPYGVLVFTIWLIVGLTTLIYWQSLLIDDGEEDICRGLLSRSLRGAAMEVQVAVVTCAFSIGWIVRSTWKEQIPICPPCHCHCTFEIPSGPHSFPLLLGLVILVCALLVALAWLSSKNFELRRLGGGSPKGGKGVQGLSSRFMQLTQ